MAHRGDYLEAKERRSRRTEWIEEGELYTCKNKKTVLIVRNHVLISTTRQDNALDAFQLTRVAGPSFGCCTPIGCGERPAFAVGVVGLFQLKPYHLYPNCYGLSTIMNTIPEQDESADSLERKVTQASHESQTASE